MHACAYEYIMTLRQPVDDYAFYVPIVGYMSNGERGQLVNVNVYGLPSTIED